MVLASFLHLSHKKSRVIAILYKAISSKKYLILKFYVLGVELFVHDLFQRRGRPRKRIVFVFWRSSSARDLFQRRGRPRKWVVLMYQSLASVYFRSVAASSFLSIYFISFLYFRVRPSSTGQYKTHSSLHFILTALVLSC